MRAEEAGFSGLGTVGRMVYPIFAPGSPSLDQITLLAEAIA